MNKRHKSNGAVILLAAAVVLGASACSADPANPLIGKWKLTGIGYVDRDGHNYCDSTPEIEFTADARTVYASGGPGPTKEAVQYLVSGDKVYASSTPSFFRAPSYTMLSATQMQPDAMGHCTYTRE